MKKLLHCIFILCFTGFVVIQPVIATAGVVVPIVGSAAAGAAGSSAAIIPFPSAARAVVNPWAAAIVVGMILYEVYVRGQDGAQVGIKPKNAPDFQPVTESSFEPNSSTHVVSTTQYYWSYAVNLGTCNGSPVVIDTSVASLGAQLESILTGCSTTMTYTYYSTDGTNGMRFHRSSKTDGSNQGDYTEYATGHAECLPGASWDGAQCVEYQQTCPEGSTMQGGLCYADVLPADGWKSYRNQDGQLIEDPRDWQEAAPANMPDLQQQGVDPGGNPYKQDVIPQSDGGIKIHTETEVTRDGQPTRTITQDVTVDKDGNVIKSVTRIQDGSLDDVASNTAQNTVTVDLPEDYARDGKQCGWDAEHPCATQLDEKSDEWQQQRDDLMLKATDLQTQLNIVQSKFENSSSAGTSVPLFGDPGAFDPNISLPAGLGVPDIIPNGSNSCSPMTTSFLGRTVEFDYCPVAMAMKPLLEWFFWAVAGSYVVLRVVRRDGGSS